MTDEVRFPNGWLRRDTKRAVEQILSWEKARDERWLRITGLSNKTSPNSSCSPATNS